MIVRHSATHRLLSLFCLFLSAAASGCSASGSRASLAAQRKDDPERFKVSVVTDGHQVKDFSHDLVHRVSLTPGEVDRMIAAWPAGFHQVTSTREEYDTHGKFMGLKIVGPAGPGTTVRILKLVDRDVITAVGLNKVKSEKDLLVLFQELKKSGYSTMTIERGGMPHKYLFYSQTR